MLNDELNSRVSLLLRSSFRLHHLLRPPATAGGTDL